MGLCKSGPKQSGKVWKGSGRGGRWEEGRVGSPAKKKGSARTSVCRCVCLRLGGGPGEWLSYVGSYATEVGWSYAVVLGESSSSPSKAERISWLFIRPIEISRSVSLLRGKYHVCGYSAEREKRRKKKPEADVDPFPPPPFGLRRRQEGSRKREKEGKEVVV